jgi:hypothetical protein
MRFAQWDANAQSFQCRQPVRHQPFAACFIDGRMLAIRDHDTQAALACGNCCSQARRPSTNNEYIC